jgi:preprotein translocase subunit SecA
MSLNPLKWLLGSKNERELRRMRKIVATINEAEKSLQSLDDASLKAKTTQFRQRFSQGESLDSLLPDAFAVCREASRRIMGMRHYDVQLIGGITLHEGRIAEMRTGEGKTLMSTLAAYLNAISGQGVHIVTVNDYLAKRDANWMRPLYESLGLSVGVISSMQPQDEKRAAYQADITYGTNNEFGFDYLRDNMVLRKEDRVQRPLYFAVVDEVDSILIDEARTPLIISGSAEDSSALYRVMNTLTPTLEVIAPSQGERNEKIMYSKVQLAGQVGVVAIHDALKQAQAQNCDLVVQDASAKPPICALAKKGHYVLDEKTRQVELTEEGHELVEKWLVKNGLMTENDSLYSAANLNLLHHVHTSLKAHTLYHSNVEYIVQDGQVILIDEHTGRTMPGRRLSEGLHQAIEAKEGVAIQHESQTLASTTFQNYFRIYQKLAGMTGTADTEAVEFQQIYNLDVVVIPTNKPVARQDLNDLVFLTMDDKLNAIVEQVRELKEKGVPILVGTASVESSEEVSRRFKAAGIAHEVLNAKQHAREAEIIAEAGRPGAVTVATNMAGRGTDIVLGGNWESEVARIENPTPEQIAEIKSAWKIRNEAVKAAGGLHIIGSERHESRRIDNQLRGRAGRQGDPGLSRFFLSLEDNLMRIFASDRVRAMMGALGMEKGEAIEAKMVTRAIEKAQRKVEGRNFDYRKQLLEYDDVANAQRQVIYAQRNDLLEMESIEAAVHGIRAEVIEALISAHIPPQSLFEQWDLPGLENAIKADFGVDLPLQNWIEQDKKLYEEPLRAKILSELDASYHDKCARLGHIMRTLEKQLMLHILDTLWKEHLQTMDHLRQGIGLRAYAQKNPKQEYKREAFELFQQLLTTLKQDVTRVLFKVEPMSDEQMQAMEAKRRQDAEAAMRQQQLVHQEAPAFGELPAAAPVKPQAPVSEPIRLGPKIGRNDPCPCGSGKKYKNCHGALS